MKHATAAPSTKLRIGFLTRSSASRRRKKEREEREREERDAAINYLLLNNPITSRPTAIERFGSPWDACMKGEVGKARQIFLSGVDVNWQSLGATPAWIACQNGHTECLSLLIDHGSQLDKAENEGGTPAIIACQNGHTECLSLLINHGAQLDKADNEGGTPAYTAC
jgi:ankyrin repeat protein